jgi:UDP-N-acetylglucosamine 3-dehydrogenase
MASKEIPLRAGLIGCGRMGSHYAFALQKTKKVTLGGICDPLLTKDRIESFGCQSYADEDSLLSDPNIDIVIIAVPSDLHRDLCLRSAANGKHVLVEKPMALSLRDAEQMIRSAESNKVRLMVGLVERFNPAYRKIKQVLELSKLGEIISVSVTRKTKSVNRPAWYWDAQRSGGVIVDLAIHDIDLIQWLLNDKVETVYALSPGPQVSGVLDTAMLLLRFREGPIASLDVSWRLDPSYPFWGNIRMEILGEQGMVVADSGLLQPLYLAAESAPASFIHTQQDLKWAGVDIMREDVIQSMLEVFAESIVQDTPLEASGYDGLKALEIALSAMESLARKGPINMAANTI